MIHAPAIGERMIEGGVDNGGGRSRRPECRRKRAAEIDPVEAEDDVGRNEGLHGFRHKVDAGRTGVQGMVGGEGGADLQIRDDARSEALGKSNAVVPSLDTARGTAGKDDRTLGCKQQLSGLRQRFRGCGRRRRRTKPSRVDLRARRGERLLLHAGIEIDVDGPPWRGLGNPCPAQQGLLRRRRRGRLIVPFHVGPDHGALIACRVQPVDPRPPLGGIDRSGCAQHQHRHPVAPGVEYGHGRIEQPNIGVQGHRHGPAGHLGKPVRYGHRVLLVQAEEHLRALVAQVVHQAVVQPAKAGARRERNVGNLERPQRRRRHVAAEGRSVGQRSDGTLDVVHGSTAAAESGSARPAAPC